MSALIFAAALIALAIPAIWWATRPSGVPPLDERWDALDEHAATALALLTPDAFDDMPTPLADEVESWLRAQRITEEN